MTETTETENQEHPFAAFIRALGKGRKGTRALTEAEAYTAMCMILDDEVDPVQLGALLMLMRVKEETPQELVGFVRAVRESLVLPKDLPDVQLDWTSYAGKRRHLPWFLLCALLLAENGIPVFMHGVCGHTTGRVYIKDVLDALGLEVSSSLADAAGRIKTGNFAYLDLKHLSPRLREIMDLRPLLGLRSPVNTVVRLLNPFSAPYMMQGVFHPGYRPMHQEAGLLLKQPHMAVLKGEGGEIERTPDTRCLVQCVHNGRPSEEEWPPMFQQRHVREETLDPTRLAAVWKGSVEDEYATAAIVGTAAITLKMMGRADTKEGAEKLAHEMWLARPREKYSTAA